MENDIEVFDGCSSSMAMAVEAFASQWEPYSSTSRHYFLYNLVEEIVDPAWRRYIDTLAESHPGRPLCQAHMPSQFARESGFSELADWFRNLVHAYFHVCDISKSAYDETFLATLDTMRALANECELKKPKHQPIENIWQEKRFNVLLAHKFCAFCGQPSELEAFRIDPSKRPEPGGSGRLSSKYCREHRTVRPDGLFSAAHKLGTRNRMTFKRELMRLKKQSWSVVTPRSDSGNAAVDLFMLHLIGRDAIYPDEQSSLRDLACRMIKSKLSDRKKEIVSMLASGMKAADIARQFGVSRQAISKTLKSIPDEFRFDLGSKELKPDGQAGTNGKKEASHALNPFLQSALENPEIHVIYVNPDSKLWAEYTNSSTECIGFMEVSEVSALIAWIAQCAGKQVGPGHPTIEGDFPGYGARFAGMMPPVVTQASFAIRKKTDPNGWQTLSHRYD